MKAFIFGNNQVGQLGISYDNDFALSPQELSHVEPQGLARVAFTQSQSYVVLHNGSLLSCGENDNQELARSGKRSWLHRVDALETFQLREVAAGVGFTVAVTDDGRLIAWGKNDLGQLCNGTREPKDKPRVNTTIHEAILQVACGATHCIALTRSGKVVVWGGNRWGQLGDGQLTSSTKLSSPVQLRHRPVISVACGENHNLIMTIGGNVYSWGENGQGQLGLMDTTNRLRPEQIKGLRSMGATKIAAGRNHSLVISQNGLLLAFGSNSHGQCGVDSEVKIQPQPVVVERLRELRAIDVVGGSAHTIVLCRSNSGDGAAPTRLFVMGLNSSGQLGLGNTASCSTPIPLQLPGDLPPIGIATGPMAMHSLVIAGVGANPLRQVALPSVTYDKVAEVVNAYKTQVQLGAPASQVSAAMVRLREMVSAAYASIPVLNASFLLSAAQLGHGTLCVDLAAVRGAYQLIMSTESTDPLAVVTLGRATLHLAEQLKECPVDDAENLSVFLIALENPLMLRASTFHVAIEMVIRGILAVPKYYRLILFKWLKSYPSEYFGRVLQVLQGYLTLVLTNKSLNLDSTPAILVLETLYQCNCEVKIVPEALFYNAAIPHAVNLTKEWVQFRSPSFDSNVFNYCSYPFLIHEYHKLQLLQFDFNTSQQVQVSAFQSTYPIADYIRERIALLNAAVLILNVHTPPATETPPSPPSPTSSPPAASVNAQEPAAAQSVEGTPAPAVHAAGAATAARTTVPAAAGPTSPSPAAPVPPRGAAYRLTSAAADALIERAGPEVHSMVQSTRLVRLPAGTAVTYEFADGVATNIDIGLEITVARNRILPDLIESLDRVLAGDKNTLYLPLKVSFKGEIGVDYGGIKRELFTLAVKELITRTNALAPCGHGRLLWFTAHKESATPAPGDAGSVRKQPRIDGTGFDFITPAPATAAMSTVGGDAHTEAAAATVAHIAAQHRLPYYLGLLVGLAAYNGVHVDLPLPKNIFKIIKNEELTLADLYAVDPELAAGLQALLNFEEGTGSIEEMFGVTFTASANPLIDNSAVGASSGVAAGNAQAILQFVELIEGGAEKAVTRVNRADFVKRFVQHALHGSAAQEVDLFVRGLRMFLHDQALSMCSAAELEHVLCGSKEVGDLSELRLHTSYKGGYTDESTIIQWFWNVLSSLTLADKRRFLHFVTGSERVPLGGLSFLKLTIQSTAQAETALPTSHTCFNILNIPNTYTSAAVLRERFRVALQHHEGFGLI